MENQNGTPETPEQIAVKKYNRANAIIKKVGTLTTSRDSLQRALELPEELEVHISTRNRQGVTLTPSRSEKDKDSLDQLLIVSVEMLLGAVKKEIEKLETEFTDLLK